VVIARRGTEECLVRSGGWARSRRETIEEVGRGVEGLILETRREVRLEKSADGVVGRADHALSLAVLGGGIRARHPQLHPVGEKEVTGGGVIELSTVVTLNDLNGEAELSNGRSPQIAVYKFKSMSSMRGRRGKRKTNMAA
jgi:hypothetical protein